MSYIQLFRIDCLRIATKVRQNSWPCPLCGGASGRLRDLPATFPRFLSTALGLQPITAVPASTVTKKSKKNAKKTQAQKETLTVQPVRVLDKPTTKVKLLTSKEREITAKVKENVLEKAGKEQSLNSNLLSYIELCVAQSELLKAHRSLNFYRARNKGKPGSSEIKNISIYDRLLQGYSAHGNLSKVQDVLSMIIADKIRPSIHTFAGVIECLGRSMESSKFSSNMRRIIDMLHNNEFVLDDIFNQCVFERDQREVILAAVQRFDPTFAPKLNPPNRDYSCELLTHLNSSSHNQTFVSPVAGLISLETLQMRTKEQLQNEVTGVISIKSVEQKQCDEGVEHYRDMLKSVEDQWSAQIVTIIRRKLQSMRHRTSNCRSPNINLYPFLNAVAPEVYSKIILMEIKRLAETCECYSPSMTRLHLEIGHQVLSRYHLQRKKQVGIVSKISALYEDYSRWFLNLESDANLNTRQKWQELAFKAEAGPTIDINSKDWSGYVICSIGKLLYEIILNDIKIDVNVMKSGNKVKQLVPAFYSIYRNRGQHMREDVKPHPVLVKLFQAASRDELHFDSTLVPMLCPPLPWVSIRTGGYLLSAAKLVRLPFQASQQQFRLENCPENQLYPALDSLNQLGSIPWKINTPVLDIMIDIFNSNGNDLLSVPPPPSACPPPEPVDPTLPRAQAVAVYKQRLAFVKRRRAEMYSLWCDALYRLSLANHLRDGIFWLPHNMDFRGRVYPCPPHLSHLGSDLARSILVFAKGEPLGEKGLDWLKIHVINLTGLKKRSSVVQRLEYANEILDDILDSAEQPMTGKKWWMVSEEPWQTLSCCIEIRNAINSGDPAAYISHLPIHQDGSCNGLQHYAALGRDEAGGISVNLAPSEIPQDVYSDVAALVEKQRASDAANGLQIASDLEGFIKRKVIKQTVMTTVYGVTRYGARLQIVKQLKDIPEFPQEQIWRAGSYLTARTFDSLLEMFTSTKEIQDWFTGCAKMISQVCGQSVEWVTPLGLPVVQPYIKQAKKTISYSSCSISEQREFCDMYERPNVMKQKNAFPPNFIHSLDSSHMMLTSLNCERAGITFVSVHDCFWTHPKSVEIMNKICREQFVALHSQPILEDLSEFLMKKYSYSDSDIRRDGPKVNISASKMQLNEVLTSVPRKGSFDLDNVLKSVYFFS